MEWTPKLLEYRDKLNSDIQTWMNGIPTMLPTGSRKKILKRNFKKRLDFSVSKFERTLTIEESEFLKGEITKIFNEIVNNLPKNNLVVKKKKSIFALSKSKTP